jgi:hypothetical protein
VDVINLPFPPFTPQRRKTLVYIYIYFLYYYYYYYFLRVAWEPIHKKYKANKSMRTHGTKEHSNRNTTNTLIKWNGFLQPFFSFCVKIGDYAPPKNEKKREYFVAISLFLLKNIIKI